MPINSDEFQVSLTMIACLFSAGNNFRPLLYLKTVLHLMDSVFCFLKSILCSLSYIVNTKWKNTKSDVFTKSDLEVGIEITFKSDLY